MASATNTYTFIDTKAESPLRNLADCAIIGQKLDVRGLWHNNQWMGHNVDFITGLEDEDEQWIRESLRV
jgi:hypothetical protein